MRLFRLLLTLFILTSLTLSAFSCSTVPYDDELHTDASSDDNALEESVTDKTESTEEETTTQETTQEEIKMPITLKIGSYNIKHGADAKLDLSIIANVINQADLDIVGIQEVDYNTTRSNRTNQPKLLSTLTDMPYYLFTPAIDYQGGKYGTLILSKYPITSSEVIPLESGKYEKRALGHTVIDVNGTAIDFFNTHLSYEDTTTRSYQFFAISEKLDGCKNFILTGDFNTANFSEFSILGGNLINNLGRSYPTFPGSTSAIDNIVFSDSFKETASGTVTKSYSDHYLLWAEFELEDQ